MKIKINKLGWTVKFKPGNKFSSEEDMKKHGANLGLTDPIGKIININTDLDPDLFFRTIRHELVHAFIWSYGLDNSLPFDEEQLACFVEVHGPEIEQLTDKVNEAYETSSTKSTSRGRAKAKKRRKR